LGRRPTGKARPYMLAVRLSELEHDILMGLYEIFCEELYIRYGVESRSPPKSEEFRFLLRRLAEEHGIKPLSQI